MMEIIEFPATLNTGPETTSEMDCPLEYVLRFEQRRSRTIRIDAFIPFFYSAIQSLWAKAGEEVSIMRDGRIVISEHLVVFSVGSTAGKTASESSHSSLYLSLKDERVQKERARK